MNKKFLLGTLDDLRKLKAEGHEFVAVKDGETRMRMPIDQLITNIEQLGKDLESMLTDKNGDRPQ